MNENDKKVNHGITKETFQDVNINEQCIFRKRIIHNQITPKNQNTNNCKKLASKINLENKIFRLDPLKNYKKVKKIYQLL